jgi:hypothetical protein
VVEVQSGLRDRNRRLLGGLNKHLQKAESRLSEESTKVWHLRGRRDRSSGSRSGWQSRNANRRKSSSR